MKILLVSMNNHHFKRWAQQVQHPSLELYWFDVLDQGSASSLDFTTQITGWKKGFLKKRGRTLLKSKFPKLFNRLVKRYDVGVEFAFAKAIKDIQPDIVHCFEMKIAGLKILPVMQQNNIPLIYSSWGTDLYDFKGLGITQHQCTAFLKRVNYLITDCKRDVNGAVHNGFTGSHLGIFPGNGGLEIANHQGVSQEARFQIIIKGYQNAIGKALPIIQAIELLGASFFKDTRIFIYSASDAVVHAVRESAVFQELDVHMQSSLEHIANAQLLLQMGKSSIHIANSLSDGMPNALLEAMAMGAFPIQSNPGGVTQEVITHGKNGLLISNPEDVKEIAAHIKNAMQHIVMRQEAQIFNRQLMLARYERTQLKPAIQQLYLDLAKTI